MALEASTLSVVVNSSGIVETTKALNDLATAGEKAEKSTSNIGSGAQASAKKQIDAAQQAAAGFDALVASVRAVSGAQDVAARALGQTAAQTSAADKEAAAFVATLKRQAETVGMSTKELREYNAEQMRMKAATLGVSQQVDGYINSIKNAKGPHESFNLLTAGSARELMVLGHELSQGQFQRFGGSLIVLGERINFLPSLLEKAGAAASSLGLSLGVFIGAIAASAAVIGAAIYTYNKSAQALKELNHEVVLTGGSAGATGDALYTMANRIGSSFGEFGKAREAVMSLAATGRFAADQINIIAEAAVGLEKYAGVSIEKTTAAFEKLAGNPLKITDKGFKDVSNAAMQLDEQMHFLEPTVLAHIMQLERQGEHATASRVAIKALADEEKNRAEELKAQLTPLGALLDTLAAKASNFWNNLLHKGSMTDQINAAKDALQHAQDNGVGPTRIKKLQDELSKLQNKVLQDNYDAAEQGHKKTMDRLANEQLTYMRNLMERSKGEENLQQRLARFDNIIAQQRERAKNDPTFRAMTGDMLSDDSVAMMRKQVERDSIKAGPKPKADGLAGLNQHLAEANAKYEIDKRYYDNQIKFIDDLQQKRLISNSVADHAKKEFLENESQLEHDSLEAQLRMVDGFYSKDTRLMEDAATKRAELRKRIERNEADTAARQDRSATDPAARAQKEQDDADAKAAQFIKTIASQTQALQDKIDAYNRVPEAARAAITNEKQMQDEFTKAEIEWKQQQIDAITAMGEGSAEEVIRLNAEKKALEDRAKAQKDWEEIQAKINAAAGRSSALTKVATEQVRMWKDIGSEIEKSLTSAFGNAGTAAGKMFKAFAEGQADQISLTNQARVVRENASLSVQEKEKQLNDIQLQGAQNQVGMYGNMADAASGFFDKGSTGYQAMAKAAMVLHTAEVALSLIKGVNAILTQGEGDPYTAFARMAAMTAIVAGLGVAVTGGGSGGSFSSADQQKIQGTGTVLGSQTITDGTKVILVGEKSNSIANSLKIVEKTSGLGLAVQNNMLTAMTSLNNNITALAKSIATSGSLTGVTAQPYLTGISSVVANTLGKIPLIGGMIGKIATSIFGGKVTVDDTGLQVNKQSLAQIAAQGVSASQYTNTTKSGGWFSSDKHNTDLSKLDPNTTDQFTKVVLSMEDAIKQAGVSLGVSGDAFNQRLNSFVVDIGKVSLKGMNSDQIQTTLQNIFSKLGDQMSMFMFSDLAKFQKVGEGLLETVSRVANDLMQVNDVFKVLGKTMPQAAAGIAQAEKLVDSFGSSDALTKAVKSYQDAIYTDNEKLAPVVKSVQDSLAAMGLSSVKTKEDFKLVVDSLDLTSDSGVALFNKLMTLAPTFGSAIDGLAKVNDTTKSSIQSVIDKLKQFSDNIHKFRDGLVLSASSPLTPQQQLAAAASQFETTIKKAMAGDENAQGHVTDIAQSYLDAARTMFASSDSYTAIFQKVEDELAKVQDFADGGVSDAQKQLDTMTNQLTSLNTLNGTATDILNSLNNLVNGASPASTATNSNATNAELLQTLKTLVGTVQQSDANNVNALQNNAAATYDSQASVGKAIGEVIKAVITTTKTGELYQTVER
jgi:phage-related minor tail protein